MSSRRISEVFSTTVAGLADEARAAGTTLSEVCDAIGVSRATPSRWRRRLPATIAVLDRIQAEIRRRGEGSE